MPNVRGKDITSGGKYSFTRDEKKENISVPLSPSTIKKIDLLASSYRMRRTELLRNMIEFATKNEQFKALMEQLR